MDPFDLKLWPGYSEAIKEGAFEKISIPQSSIVHHITIDSRTIESKHSENVLFVALPGFYTDGHHFILHAAQAGAKFALINKAWPLSEKDHLLLKEAGLTLLRVNHPLKSFQEIVSCYRQTLSTQFIAITGSFGKTMLKDLLYSLIKANFRTQVSPESFNSQIGVALSILKVNSNHEIALIETGISEEGEMDTLAQMVKPNAVILTNIGDAHLGTLHTLSKTAKEKSKIFSSSAPTWALIPQDPLLIPHIQHLKTTFYFWNQVSANLPHATYVNHPLSNIREYVVEHDLKPLFNGFIHSAYQLDLINIALKAAWLLNTPQDVVQEALKHHRMEQMTAEIWESPTGVTFFNEGYCSDDLSVKRALKHFQKIAGGERTFFLFGGIKQTLSPKHWQHLIEIISEYGIDECFCYGSYACKEAFLSPTKFHFFSSFDEALISLIPKLKKDDYVLIKGIQKQPLDKILEAFNDSISNNQCLIHLARIKENLSIIRSYHPHIRLMVMIKAFAYGMNDKRIAHYLAHCGIDILGVSYADEAISLKKAGVSQDIFVLNAALYEAAKVVKWGFEIGVSDMDMIQALVNEAKNYQKKVKVHLHIDTGMGRFGCRPEEALSLALYIHNCPSLILQGVMTHFACAENAEEDEFTKKQAAFFDDILKDLHYHSINAPWIHASNSGALLRHHFPQYNMARIGLSLYGLYPSKATHEKIPLQLAITLSSRIVGINICKKGDTISYGRTYKVEKEQQKIAVLPIGYFDGLHRQYSGKGYVLIYGQKAPMVGMICMDYMMVDITEIPNAKIGDPVLIFGYDEFGHTLAPETLAEQGQSIVYELITCLGPRIPRIFIQQY